MEEALITLVKTFGLPALPFVFFVVYYKWSMEKERERQHQQHELIMQQFIVLKDLTETIQYQTAILARVETKIDSNQYCPLVRKRD